MSNYDKEKASKNANFEQSNVSTTTTQKDKIQRKFYPLQLEEWVVAYEEESGVRIPHAKVGGFSKENFRAFPRLKTFCFKPRFIHQSLLSHSDFLRLTHVFFNGKNLTKSQLSVLYYLRSLAPYGNGVKIKASLLAEKLEITKRAVNLAFTELDKMGFLASWLPISQYTDIEKQIRDRLQSEFGITVTFKEVQ